MTSKNVKVQQNVELCSFLGGKLKTLEEQDDESLQAQWFTINDIMLGHLKLRYSVF